MSKKETKSAANNASETARLQASDDGKENWKKYGPYLSERQWGTVREDYSAGGDAWGFVTHDHSRSKAYRWGEEGIGGISDDSQKLCLSLALWNHKDPILKDNLFGLTGAQGNHGEDVKEYYYYLDSTPTHSYMKMLYKYPQAEFPYAWLVEENARRGKDSKEFELIDTGVFKNDRYFDVFIEYTKAGPEDILLKVTAHNRGPEDAPLELIPTVWFRNIWSWGGITEIPVFREEAKNAVGGLHPILGGVHVYADGEPEILFCDNETNVKRLYETMSEKRFFKDGINDFVVRGDNTAVNPEGAGSKVGFRYSKRVPSGGEVCCKLRLSEKKVTKPLSDFDSIFNQRLAEANEYYAEIQKDLGCSDLKNIQRQALAGMLWTKQFYYYDIPQWLEGDEGAPTPPPERKRGRNSDWEHLNNADIISMPDKWEYPWFAAWDLAFHCLPLAMVDPKFAKEQLVLMTREWYMHPNGQLPAYEWNFGDVNPPVHAWATWRVFQIDRKMNNGKGDLAFLERVFHKLLLNFTWWVNRKDEEGNNLFQGGFLGLDNIGVFDRSAELPTGGHINQADGTSWMAMYSLNLLRMSLELSRHNPVYQDVATKFFEHFLHIARAMTDIAGEGRGLWDEEDKFFYDVLRFPNGHHMTLKVRSMVGLIPLFAVETLEPELLEQVPEFKERLDWFLDYRPDLAELVSRWHEPGRGERRLLSLLRVHRFKKLLNRLLDETEFLSDYGVRALSRYHLDNPFAFEMNGQTSTVKYTPAESDSYMFGGNSNWRGPIWFPVNYLIIESLQKFHHYYGDEFRIEFPVGSGETVTALEVSEELTRRLVKIFAKDKHGKRPVFGLYPEMSADPNFSDYIPFYEYFDGESGRGVGASHQTGWTGLVAKLIQPRGNQSKLQDKFCKHVSS